MGGAYTSSSSGGRLSFSGDATEPTSVVAAEGHSFAEFSTISVPVSESSA